MQEELYHRSFSIDQLLIHRGAEPCPFYMLVSGIRVQIVEGTVSEGKGGMVMGSGGFFSPPQPPHSASCTLTVLGQWLGCSL